MTHWSETLPADLTVEQDGKPTPIRELPIVKEAPDLGTFAKRAVDQHRELGGRIPIKAETPEAREAWKKEHLPKLYSAGILEAPPASAEEYNVARPENVPETNWNPEATKELAGILHKHGAPKALAGELVQLHAKVLEHAQGVFKADGEKVMAEIKAEFGDQTDARLAAAERAAKEIFADPADVEFLNRTGLGNNPRLLRLIMRIAPQAQSGSSFVRDGRPPGSTLTGKAAGDEARAIIRDKAHPKHEAYMRGDQGVNQYVQELLRAENPAERTI